MNRTTALIAGLALVSFTAPAFAHHSFAMFNTNKTMALSGTVKELEWTNPHSWIHIMVPGKDGKPQQWSLEMASIVQMTASGWKPSSVKPGDRISVNMHPLKDGTRGGQMLDATLQDGTHLGHGYQPPHERVPPKTF